MNFSHMTTSRVLLQDLVEICESLNSCVIIYFLASRLKPRNPAPSNVIQSQLSCALCLCPGSHCEFSSFQNMWTMLGMTTLPHIGGFLGGIITRSEVKTWYKTLQKPSWRPPNAAFPVVWTCLYTGMGYVQTP